MSVIERSTKVYEGSRIPSPIPTALQVDPDVHASRRHPHDQLRPEPSFDPRRVATRRRPRRRDGRRHLGRDRLPPHRVREDDGAEDLVEVHHLPGADRLRLVPGERARVRARDREAARDRGAAQGDLDADVPRRADADPLAPRLARHLGARARSDLDVLVHVRRPRRDPRPLRDGLRHEDAHPLFPGGRARRGHPRRLLRAGTRVVQEDAEGDRRVRGDPRSQRHLAQADEGHRASLGRRRDRARPVGPGAARLRRRLGSPQEHAVPRLRRGRVRRAGVPGRRRLRPLPGPHGGDARVRAHRVAVPRPARGDARRTMDRGRPQGRACRRARSCIPRWSR